MKTLLVTISALVTALPSIASADPDVGVEIASVFPLRTWSDTSSAGLGAIARLELPVNDVVEISLRGGFLYHGSHDYTIEGLMYQSTTSELPVLAGARVFLYRGTVEIYGAADAGLVVLHASDSRTMLDFTDAKLGGSLGLGLRRGRADVLATLFAPSFANANHTVGVLFTAGFTITSL